MSDRDITKRYLGITEHKPKPRLSNMYKEVLLNEGPKFGYDDEALTPDTPQSATGPEAQTVRRRGKGKDGGQFVDKDEIMPDCPLDKEKCDELYQSVMRSGDTDKINRMFSFMQNISSYPILLDHLTAKKWSGQAVKRYAQELGNAIEKHASRVDDKIKELQDYIQNTAKQQKFGGSSNGNLIRELSTSGPKLDKALVTDLFSHKTQDEKTRGVGMGELAMTLFYSNIGSAEGAGDLGVGTPGYYDPAEFDSVNFSNTGSPKASLAINGSAAELEVKGHGAVLGDAPEARKLNKDSVSALLGITEVGTKLKIAGSEETLEKNQFATAIATAYKLQGSKLKDEFKDNLWSLLSDPNQGDITGQKQPQGVTHAGEIEDMFYKIDFSNSEDIQWTIGLMNFVRYSGKEGFDHFMVHDFGSVGKLRKTTGTPGAGAPGNTGKYVYVTGGPTEMAASLRKLESTGLDFEGISMANVRPRIGLPTAGKDIKSAEDRQKWSRTREPGAYRKK